MRMRAAALALVAVVFAAGVVSGVAIDRLWGPHRPGPPHGPGDGPRGGPPGFGGGGRPPPERFFAELTAQLDLGDAQRAAIKSTLDRAQERALTVFGRARPELEAIRAETRTAILAQLTPAQQDRFRVIEQEELQRHPPPDGPLHDGPPRDGPPHDGPLHDGPLHDGPPHDGPLHDGPPPHP